jgi:SAM-dependent methyltransferase
MDIDISSEIKTYSVEIECLVGCEFTNFSSAIDTTIRILQDTDYPISVQNMSHVLKRYKEITGKNKFAGIQPKTLSDEKIDKKEKYAITKKLDGQRYNLICIDEFLYSVSNKLEVKWIPYKCSIPDVILDVEYYRGYYHIFDIVGSKYKLEKRIEEILKIIAKITPLNDAPKIVLKEYVLTKDTFDLCTKFKNIVKNLDSNVYDGLILIKQNKDYGGSDPLKWKPVHMNTVDFQIEKRPGNVFLLYVGDKDGLVKFGETIVSKENFNKYNDSNIIEFSYVNNSWEPLKIRNDKDKPNFITIAQDNFNSVLKPFNPDETLCPNTALFNMRRFHNYIKRTLIEKYKGKSVLDMASGKGGDFGKYIDSGFLRIDGYDINAESVKESLSRVVSKTTKTLDNVNITVTVKDLTKEIISSNVKFDLVVTNFAFHYFYKTLDIYLKSVTGNLKKGGHLILTFFDGNSLTDIKNKNFEIKKISKEKVSVYIKDSVLNKPEIEYIVDPENVIILFEKNGLKLVENFKFEEMYPKWKKVYSKNSMSSDEKYLSFLNVALVFKAV